MEKRRSMNTEMVNLVGSHFAMRIFFSIVEEFELNYSPLQGIRVELFAPIRLAVALIDA